MFCQKYYAGLIAIYYLVPIYTPELSEYTPELSEQILR